MQAEEHRIATVGIPAHPSLTRSRLAVWFLLAICVFIASLSMLMFGYQVTLQDEFGDFYRNQPGAWPNLLTLLLRAIIGIIVAWTLWRYLRAVRKSINAAHGEADEVFRALARYWNVLALSGLLLLSNGVWLVFFAERPDTTRPISHRFEATRPEQTTVKVEFRMAEASPHEAHVEAHVVSNSQPIWMQPEPFITNQDITEARVVQDYFDKPAVEVKFTLEGQEKLSRTTAANIDKLLAIVIDGRVVTAPIVRSPLTGGQAMITGEFTRDEAERIARGLSGRE